MSASDDGPAGGQAPGVRTRGPELGLALVLLALSALVITDSMRVGNGWAADGPKAGYFPFYIGIGLAVTGGLIALQQLRQWRTDQRQFVETSQLADVWAVLWPMVVYVALIMPLGIYLASLVLIVYFMRRHGRFSWAKCIGIALAVVLSFFSVFERWFNVPLPKGPVERWLGF